MDQEPASTVSPLRSLKTYLSLNCWVKGPDDAGYQSRSLARWKRSVDGDQDCGSDVPVTSNNNLCVRALCTGELNLEIRAEDVRQCPRTLKRMIDFGHIWMMSHHLKVSPASAAYHLCAFSKSSSRRTRRRDIVHDRCGVTATQLI